MKTSSVRFVCRVLVASMLALPLHAQAGMIGTGEAVTAAQAQAARAGIAALVSRSEAAAQLQALGLSPQAVKERVAALTDAEVVQLAGRIDQLPAGAIGGGFFGLLFVAIFLLWRFVFSDQAQAETAKPGAKPAAKPAAKPEAEKK
jgi:hypothetical protein